MTNRATRRVKKTKRTLIATETLESLSVRLSLRAQTRRARVFCEECEAEVPLVTPEEAAAHANLSVRAVYRLVESNRIHFKETSDGTLLVCLNNYGRANDKP